MTHIRRSIIIHAKPEEVYRFARDPRYWADWYVGLSEPRTVSGTGEVGTVVESSYLLVGIHFPVTLKVPQEQEGPEVYTHTVTFVGPLAGVQIATYRPRDAGTEATFEIDYEVPAGALGRIADRFVIERMQERVVEHTLVNLKEHAEARIPAVARS
jgi:hypothetical protein